jgi:hypothetical protein
MCAGDVAEYGMHKTRAAGMVSSACHRADRDPMTALPVPPRLGVEVRTTPARGIVTGCGNKGALSRSSPAI